MRRGVFISLCVALAAALAPLVAVNAGPAPMPPSELQANPDRFDGHRVTLQGTVEKLREKVSPDGVPYFKFRWLGRLTYYHQVTATHVTCR